MKYSRLNLGQIEALINKTGGLDQVYNILSGRSSITVIPQKPWQTVLVGEFPDGTSLTVDSLRKAFVEYGFVGQEGDASCVIPDNIRISRPGRIDLVLLKVEDLGFSMGGQTGEIYEAADAVGLDICPDETAAQVLMQTGGPTKVFEKCGVQFATDFSHQRGFRIRTSSEGKPYLTRFTNTYNYPRDSWELFVFKLRRK